MSLDIKLRDDDDTNYNYHIDLSKHLIDADKFGLPKGSFCYIPIFQLPD